MHLRRALLLFAVVLGATVVASLLAPRRHEGAPSSVQTAPRASSPAAVESMRLRFPVRTPPRTLRVAAGQHLQLEVATTVPGQASAFGTVLSAEALTPASFDVLAPQRGSYPVTFQPSAGAPVRLATVSVAPRAAAPSESGRRP